MKRVIFYCIMILAGFLLALVGTELLLRLSDPLNKFSTDRHMKEMASFLISDSVLNHKLKPNVRGRYALPGEYSVEFRTDSAGYRFVNGRRPKNPSRVILFLGDSMIQALECRDEETLPFLVEQSLDSISANDIQCVNLGVSSYSPIFYYLTLKSEAKRYNPVAVVVGYYLGNDINGDNEIIERGLLSYRDGQPEKVAPKGTMDGKYDLKALSALYCYFIHFKDLARPFLLATCGPHIFKTLGFHPEKWPRITDRTMGIFSNTLDEPSKASIDTSLHFLDLIKKYCDERSITVVVLLIPPGNQLNRNMLSDGYHIVEPTFGTLSSENPQKYLSERLVAMGIDHIDLRKVFDKHLDQELYFRVDGHLRPQGQKVVADTLSSMLNKIL